MTGSVIEEREVWPRVPVTVEHDTTYYDRPLLKKSVWGIDIPLYYFLGGTAGAAMTLGAAIQLVSARGHELRKISAICHWTGIVGSTAGAACLIHDLGRPSRFVYMMRVFRPTSPMNIGSWILAGAAPTAIATGLWVNRRDWLGTVAEATGYISGAFGAALAGYTGVLVSNSAIPVWQAARRWMPVMFAASSMASAASVIDVIAPGNGITRVFGTAGRIAEIAAAQQVERTASEVPRVGEPLRRSALWKAATVLTAGSLVAGLAGKRRIAGVLGIAGSLCLRFAVHYASNASARDARAVFAQQRAAV